MPLVSPVTEIGLAVLLPVIDDEPATQVAVYAVIAAPPLLVGAVKAMLAEALPAVAVPIVGAPATVLVEPDDEEDPPPQPANNIVDTIKADKSPCLFG